MNPIFLQVPTPTASSGQDQDFSDYLRTNPAKGGALLGAALATLVTGMMWWEDGNNMRYLKMGSRYLAEATETSESRLLDENDLHFYKPVSEKLDKFKFLPKEFFKMLIGTTVVFAAFGSIFVWLIMRSVSKN